MRDSLNVPNSVLHPMDRCESRTELIDALAHDISHWTRTVHTLEALLESGKFSNGEESSTELDRALSKAQRYKELLSDFLEDRARNSDDGVGHTVPSSEEPIPNLFLPATQPGDLCSQCTNSTSQREILVIEPDVDVQKLLKILVGEAKAQPLLCSGREEGLRVIRDHTTTIDWILLDRPIHDHALERFLDDIRQVGSRAKVVVLSTSWVPLDEPLSRQIVRLLPKPFDADGLVRLLSPLG